MALVWLAVACVLQYYSFKAPTDPVPTLAYMYLGDAFLEGQTHLDISPHPELAKLSDPYDPALNDPYNLADFSYFNNKYYLYFGPGPALLLYIPVKLITDFAMDDAMLTFIFACVGTGFLFLFIYLAALQRRNIPFIAMLSVLLALGFGTWLPFLLRRAFFYEVAISGAYCFSAIAIVCLWCFLQNTQRRWWLGLASFSIGCAISCRVSHLISGVVLLSVLIYLMRSQPRSTWLSCLLWMGIPVSLWIGGLGLYNYERFGNPFENGISYHLGMYKSNDPEFRYFVPETAALHAYKYLLKPVSPDLQKFPYVNVRRDWRPYPSFEAEPVYGMLTNNPFSLFFLGYLLDARTRNTLPPGTRVLARGLAWYATSMLVFLIFFFFSTQRYAVDFAPWMMAASSIYYLQLVKNMQGTRYYHWLLWGGLLAAVIGALATCAAGYCGYTKRC